MEKEKMLRLIDERKEELFDLLCRLVRFDSQNFGVSGNEEACARYIAGLCEELGLETDLYSPMDLPGFASHPDYFPEHHLQNRLNVTARMTGASGHDALMLMGHSDTVPIGERSSWDFDPLAGELRDGKIFGRGACDDKYALATALFVLKLLKENGFVPKDNILFSAYSDEEYGGSHGALASCLRYPADRIVNMDCKHFEIWQCASGGGELSYHFHTAKPTDSAGRTQAGIPVVMEEIEKFAERRRTELAANRFYAGTDIPGTALRYLRIWAGLSTVDMGKGFVHFVFYTDKTREEIESELREIESVLSERLAPLGITGDGFVHDTRFFHYGYTDPESPFIKDMCAAAQDAGAPAPLVCGSCLSDLSVILKYGGGEAFGFGIGRGFDAPGGAHQPNEYIECAPLVDYAKTIMAFILRTM